MPLDTRPADENAARVRAFAIENSDAAFAAVVRRYGPGVFAMCYQQLRHRQAAEDATQAVFLALAKAAPRLGSGVVLSGWLFQAARYVCANLRRSEDRRRTHETAAARERPQVDRPATATPSTGDVLAVHDAIATLGRADRDLITLRYFHDVPPPALAVALNVAEPTVRKRLSRAVERLRGVLTARGGATAGVAGLAVLEATAGAAGHAPTGLADSIVAAATGKAAVTPAMVELARHAATAGRWAWAGPAAVAAGVLVLAVGAGVAVQAVRPGSAEPMPVVQATPPVNPAANATPPLLRFDFERLAADGDYLGAMKAYIGFLSPMRPGDYRDKKDFEWLLQQRRRDGSPPDLAAITTAIEAAIKDVPGDRTLWVWRLHRLRADLAEKQGDAALRRKHLDAAIAAYPAEVPSPASKLSSLQHLYNEVAMMTFDDQGPDAATAYLAERFRADDRFVYVFPGPWEARFAKAGGNAAMSAFIAAVEAAAEDKPATHRPQIEESLDDLRRTGNLPTPTP